MRPGDPVQTPRGEGIAEAFTPYKTQRFEGRPETIIYVYVRYRNDTVRIYPISEITPIKTSERVET